MKSHEIFERIIWNCEVFRRGKLISNFRLKITGRITTASVVRRFVLRLAKKEMCCVAWCRCRFFRFNFFMNAFFSRGAHQTSWSAFRHQNHFFFLYFKFMTYFLCQEEVKPTKIIHSEQFHEAVHYSHSLYFRLLALY